MRRILINTVFGAIVFVLTSAGVGYYLERSRQPDIPEEKMETIRAVAEELRIFAESLPDCSKGFPTGARKEVWDNYLRYCEPGVIVPKGERR